MKLHIAGGILAATAATTIAAITGLYAFLGESKKDKAVDLEAGLQRKRRKRVLNGLACPGLLNLGNTCFMNSVLQALASVQSFVQWMNKICDSKKDEKDLGTTVHDTITVLTGEGEECLLYSPSPVIQALQAHGWIFEGQQQDAHELFHVLISTIQEEKGEAPSVLSLNDMQLVQSDEEQTYVDGAVNRSQVPLRSLSEDGKYFLPFHGLLASEMICKDCGYKAPVKYDAFDSLSLCLPQYPRISRSVLSLHDLLMKFVQSEVIHDIDCISCSKAIGSKHASIQRTFIRRQTLGKLPQCLCIHVQRTYWNSMGLPFKNNSFFSFPENLDVSRYTYNTSRTVKKPPLTFNDNLLLGGGIVSCLPTQLNMNSGLRGDILAGVRGSWFPGGQICNASVFTTTVHKSIRKTKFRLVAVISHAGDVDSGHFITYRRLAYSGGAETSESGVKERWVCISDENVSTASLGEVLKCKAYMLFYE